MKFWKAEAVNRKTKEKEAFRVASPDMFNAARVRKELLGVHPEWSAISLKKIRKPKDWVGFETN